MSDADAPHAVIDYARVSADDERLGRYLRVVLGGSLLFYGGCSTLAAAFYYATMYGLIKTEMTYDVTEGNFAWGVETAAAVAMAIAGPCILRGTRSVVVAAGFITRFASVLIIVVFICEWAWSLGMARRESPDIDAWHWVASFVGSSVYLVIPILLGLLAKSPAFTRICAATKNG